MPTHRTDRNGFQLKNFKSFILAFCLTSFTAFACHTPTRSAVLNKKYPDWDFVNMMHQAHSQPYVGYKFTEPAECVDGQADIYECRNVDLMGHLDLTEIGGGVGSDSWGWKHEASGRYFAIVGRSNGTAFVEITDPANPVYLGNLRSTNGLSSAWRDIKTYQNHAFIVADDIPDHGMQVFNLARLLNISNPPITFTNDHLYTENNFGSAHNIVINEQSGHAYLVGSNTCAGGLFMLNIHNPTNPSYAGCFDADGYTHDAQCVTYSGPDQDHQGKEICFASNEDTVTIVDVTDKSNPTQLSRTGYSGQQYTHQGWLNAEQTHFIIDDELDELARGQNQPDVTRTYVMDVSDLDEPVFQGFHEADGRAVDHNQYIHNGHTYQANYTRGLRILKLGDLSKAGMEEVAYFDTYPTTTNPSNFGGAWNVYPFFDNGLVLVSDINRGVFILKPNTEPAIQISNYHTGLWHNNDQSGHGLGIQILDNQQMVVFWHTYDQAGNQIWLSAAGTYENNRAVLDAIITNGAQFPPNFNPNDVNRIDWGTIEIEFTGCDDLVISWNPVHTDAFAAGSLNMQRVTAVKGLSCEG